jgi:hypothetical protein
VAKAMGLPSLATGALIAWEWLQREVDIFATLDVAHYRPKERPNMVRVVHEKTKEENWVPLFADDGAAVYPELAWPSRSCQFGTTLTAPGAPHAVQIRLRLTCDHG